MADHAAVPGRAAKAPTDLWRSGYEELFDRLRSADGGATIRPLLARLGLIRDGLSVLSIGAGTGELEVELATRCGARIGYIDPSALLHGRFLARAAEAGVADRIVAKHLGPFETFASDARWDLVVSVHSWGYLDPSNATLEKALGLLAPGGHLCIVLGSERSEVEALKAHIRPADDPVLHLEALSRRAEAAGHTHRIEMSEFRTPLERWLDPGGVTHYGRAWLAFMGRAEWDALPRERRDRAEGFLRRRMDTGHLHGVFGALIFER